MKRILATVAEMDAVGEPNSKGSFLSRLIWLSLALTNAYSSAGETDAEPLIGYHPFRTTASHLVARLLQRTHCIVEGEVIPPC